MRKLNSMFIWQKQGSVLHSSSSAQRNVYIKFSKIMEMENRLAVARGKGGS